MDQARYIVFDTETTGLPPRAGRPEDNLALWPRLVQLAWVLFDDEEGTLEEESLIIAPEGFEIPAASERLHGISTSKARLEGIPLAVALWRFEKALERAFFVVGHNISFDVGILRAAFLRAGLMTEVADRQSYCTMRSGRDVCNLPGKTGLKNPRLGELHQHLFGIGFEGAHDALNDVQATQRCFQEMRARGIITVEKKRLSRRREVLDKPVAQQADALRALDSFLRGTSDAFVLSGAAGTGKTFLVAHLLEKLQEMDRPVQLLAPTGRAARVLALKTGFEARTIHSAIYRYAGVEHVSGNKTGPVYERFSLKRNLDPEGTVYVVDEASMVNDREGKAGGLLRFGSGRLLTDLIQYSRILDPETGNQIVFVGDTAQLPPVGSPMSPALSAIYLEENGLRTESASLETVVRQAAGSGILKMAHNVRSSMRSNMPLILGTDGSDRDVRELEKGRLIDTYEKVVGRLGTNEVILITHTNRSAFYLNREARSRLGKPEMRFVPGDRLLVVQNNYLYDLFNGDFVTVYEIDDHPEVRSPLRDVSLQFRKISLLTTQGLVECRILENLLFRHEPRLQPQETRALMADFHKRNPDIKENTAEWHETIRDDPYLNALQVKPGYAVTCHKAQGGEWHTAFVLFEKTGMAVDRKEPFRWAYTAITRARKQLYIVNSPGANPDPVFAFPGMEDPQTELLPQGPVGRSSTATRGALVAKWSVLLAGTDIHLAKTTYKGGTAKLRFHMGGSEAELIFIADAEGRFSKAFAGEGGDASLARHLVELWSPKK